MFERYTTSARKAIFFARYEASQFGSPYIESEHLLLGILREDTPLAIRLLETTEKVNSMRRRIEESIPAKEKLATSVDLPVSKPCQRAMAYGAEESERLNHRHIGTEHLLVGLLREETSLAFQIMTEQGLTLVKVREEAAKSVPPAPDLPPLPKSYIRSLAAQPGLEFSEHSEQPVRNLTALAAEGLLGPLIGRESELERIIRILSRRYRKNAVLIGEPGVGKTAIVEGLAQRIAKNAAPAWLAGRTLLAIDAADLIAPKSAPLAAHSGAILFVHGLFDFASAGYNWGVLEAVRILEPLLARGGRWCIATGTPAGYRETVAKAPMLAVHFEAVPVLPPYQHEAIEILRGVKDLYEKHHNVIIGGEAIEAAVLASGRFLRHRFLPDRALDLLDEAAALVSLRAAGRPAGERAIVTPRDVVEVSAALVGAPLAVIENLMRQPDPSPVEPIARELVALVPQGREWLERLAVYLAGCTKEEARSLAARIRAGRET